MRAIVYPIVQKYRHDATRLMDILHDIQSEMGYIPDEAASLIAQELKISVADVYQVITFYHFYSTKPRGKFQIYLNDSAVAMMMGRQEVAKAFEKEAGIRFGEVTEDGLIGLFNTSCIGMNDQEPAALINGKVFTKLTPYRAKEIIRDIRAGKSLDELVLEGYGDGNNAHQLVKSMVYNNIRKKGALLSADWVCGSAIKMVVEMDPLYVIDMVKKSNIRGRGGAGFPTGMKWEFCRKNPEADKYVICNADEGEPGTFKDRVLLTEKPQMLFEGMAIAGYAIGAKTGILYLRYEYRYLKDYLENILYNMRSSNVLGKNIGGKAGFDFDIRIQFGAGAYVCGEESALIESCEGKRGEPRDRPPFPVESGYLNKPTVVNNVETLCSIVNIIHKGADWFRNLGTKDSAGTKLLSISGDCRYPGIYEIEWGITIEEMLAMSGAENVQAVQVGGPSGTLISPDEFDRVISYADLATGGSIIIIGKERDLLKDVVLNFTEFFIEESCGSCSTCRNMTYIMKKTLEKIIEGHGVLADVDNLANWGKFLKASRCGLGQTAANPILSSIRNFRRVYDFRIQKDKDFDTGFDLASAVQESCEFVKRVPNLH
ncbi:MAG TPA: NAD(P)H-dependent oxidoreductase subunit E [Bacteroidia bacterium]|nr:NAD(P)H-dependent oxidoreductase subunit E [Bacteroidia bacterium]HRS59743.1 NAD(P)H-dependent oxidoreductase subunit E [Bacteroidia bacterium]HRU68183.1 NAD(P)H-dependent oxidoreductase subunit E [Bacteroidia bacterium]